MKGDPLCPHCYGTGKREEVEVTKSKDGNYTTRRVWHGVICEYKRKTIKDFRRIVLEDE